MTKEEKTARLALGSLLFSPEVRSMKIDLKIPFLLIILFLSVYAFTQKTTEAKSPLYPGQETVLALDNAHSWAREHRANSVFLVKVDSFADIQIFNSPQKAGKPLFHVRKHINSSLGSGTVISERGYLITAKHVIDDTEAVEKIAQVTAAIQKDNPGNFIEVKVITEYALVGPDGKSFVAFTIATDKNDLALMQVKNKKGFDAPAVEISREKDLSDKSVIVIGSPLGVKDVIMDGRIARQTLVKDKDGSIFSYVIAPIVPGNSGGPVITLGDMKMVGVVVEITTTGGSLTNIALMVPNTVINKFLDRSLPKI